MSAIDRIQQILDCKRINLPANAEIKEGYTEALRILNEKITDESSIQCVSIRARCIAGMAIDYNKGLCSEKILWGIPLNKR